MEQKINQIREEYLDKINKASTLQALDELFLGLFGKNGVVTLLPKDFPSLPKEELKVVGPLFNKTKNELEQAIEKKRHQVKEESYKQLDSETLDLTNAEIKQRTGHMHPTTIFENQIADLFSKIGFQQYDAPHIDTDFYN